MYTAKELYKLQKYNKTYAKYLKSIDPNDIDIMLNEYDTYEPDNSYKTICLRGMEKYIQRPSDSITANTIIMSSSSIRRKVLHDAILSVQSQKQQQQNQHDTKECSSTLCCCNCIAYYDELIRFICIPITIPSVQYAHEIAQKDSYIAINIKQSCEKKSD